MTTETTNRTYQDTLFRKLFSTKEKLIELYNALEDAHYGPDASVEITTLEDVFYIDRKNDLGFIIEDKFIVLAEHQATVAPNIPLRQLSYIGKTVERFLADIQVYGRKLLHIPAPQFYVMYTGDAPWPVKTLQLSSCFASPKPENSVELIVKVIDLSYNEENEILKRSPTLKGYSRLLHYIKSQVRRGVSRKAAVRAAVKWCREEDCLTEFLDKYGGEVEGMLYKEVTWDEVAELWAREAAEDSYKEGKAEGLRLGEEKGIYVLIQDNLEESVPPKRIIEKLMRRFELDRATAEEWLQKVNQE